MDTIVGAKAYWAVVTARKVSDYAAEMFRFDVLNPRRSLVDGLNSQLVLVISLFQLSWSLFCFNRDCHVHEIEAQKFLSVLSN